MPNQIREFMEQAGGFLDTFGKVVREGFFGDMKIDVSAQGPAYAHVNIKMVGFIPNDETHQEEGVSVFFDPSAAIKGIQRQVTAKGFEFRSRTCSVETSDWPILGDEDEVTGSYGTKYVFDLVVSLVNPSEMID